MKLLPQLIQALTDAEKAQDKLHMAPTLWLSTPGLDFTLRIESVCGPLHDEGPLRQLAYLMLKLEESGVKTVGQIRRFENSMTERVTLADARRICAQKEAA